MRRSRVLLASGFIGVLAILVFYRVTLVERASVKTLDSQTQVLFLHTEFFPYHDVQENCRPHLLGRELIRQAMLLAARDELGVPTFDETLRETLPGNVEVIHLLLRERASPHGQWPHGQWHIGLYPYDEEGRNRSAKPLWEKKYDHSRAGYEIYTDIIPKLESDTRDQFLKALYAAGFRKEQPARKSLEPVALDRLEGMLDKIDFIAQFAAVRSAHRTLAANSETPAPELLGILVRGYANLALLTRHQYNAVSHVFTARSWLYAQRLLVASEESDLALWHRAYAWALGGTLHHGLADLETLNKRHQGSTEGETEGEQDGLAGAASVPWIKPWTKLIEPYCMSNRAATKKIGEEDGSLKPWATRLWFELTSTYQHDTWNFHAGSEIAQLTPMAYGVYAEMTRSGAGLRTGRSGASWAPSAFGKYSPQSLDAVPGMPETIREFLPTSARKRAMLGDIFEDPNAEDLFSAVPTFIAKRLREESRQTLSGDLSWSALAYLLEEEQFVQIANYLSVSMNATESSMADEVDAVLPFIKEHRYAGYIDSYRYNKRHEAEAIERAIAKMNIEDSRGNMLRMFRQLWSFRQRGGWGMGRLAASRASCDTTMKGMQEFFFPYPAMWETFHMEVDPYYVYEVNAVIPHSEIGVRFSIYAAGNPSTNRLEEADQLEKWEVKLTEDATAYMKLGNWYDSLNDPEKSTRCYEKSMEILPNFDVAKSLATLHWQKDFDKWKNVYLEFLKSEDLNLEHAKAHGKLAEGFSYYGLWEEAKPHAVAAAQTWSAWGLRTASYLCEGLAEWEESEQWIREMSENYPSNSGESWYFWCRRTGRGNRQQAQLLAGKFFSTAFTYPTREKLIGLGAYRFLKGDTQAAMEAYRKALSYRTTFTCSLMIAQMARQLGDEKTREKVLLEMEKASEQQKGTERYDEAVHAVGLKIVELLKSGDASEDLLDQIEKMLTNIEENTRSAFAYFVGRELDELGKSEEAEKYWRRALILPNYDPIYATLAGSALAESHGTSRPDDDRLDKDDLWPARSDEGRPRAE